MSLLVISHAYPPVGEVGGLRIARLCRYLPDSGVQPIVLTVQEKYYKYFDDSFSASPRVRVERTRMMRTPLDFYADWNSRRTSAKQPNGGGGTALPPKPNRGLRSHALAALQIPDRHWGWYMPAIGAVSRLIQGQRVDAVFSSAPPYTSHLIARYVKKKFGIPWVADFRDAWAFDDWRQVEGLPRWRDYVDRQLEASCVRWADLVTSVTDPIREKFVHHYPKVKPGKFVTLTNGFDDLPVPPIPRQSGAKRLVLHLGSLYGARRIDSFCKAAMMLVESGRMDPQGVQIVFLGDANPDFVTAARQQAAQLIDMGCIEFRPRVSWRQAQEVLASADVLLVFQGDHRLGITAKFYEYLSTGKPILAIVNEGALSAIVEATSSGVWADPADPQQIASKLVEAMSLPIRSPAEVDCTAHRYHVRSLAGQLGSWVRQLVNDSAHR